MSKNNLEFTYKEWIITIILILIVIYYLLCNYNETFGVISKESCLKWDEKKDSKFFYNILYNKNKERCDQVLSHSKVEKILSNQELNNTNSKLKSTLIVNKIKDLTNHQKQSMETLNNKIDLVVTEDDLEGVLNIHKELLTDLANKISTLSMQQELGTVSEESESINNMYKLLDDHKGLLKSIHKKSKNLNHKVNSEMKLFSGDLTDGLSDLNDDMDMLSNKIDNIDISEDVNTLSESVDNLSEKIDSLGGVSVEGEDSESPLIKINKRIKKLSDSLEVLFREQNNKLSFDINNKMNVLSEDVEDLSDMISSQDETINTLESEILEMKKIFNDNTSNSSFNMDNITQGITLLENEIEVDGGKNKTELEKFDISKNFMISFKITPTSNTINDWSQIMVFSENINFNEFRNLNIFFYANSTKMHIRIRHGDKSEENKNWGSDPNYELPLNEESIVKIILLNNKQTIIIENKKDGTKTYTSTTPNKDRFEGELKVARLGNGVNYDNAKYKIKDLKYYNLDDWKMNMFLKLVNL